MKRFGMNCSSGRGSDASMASEEVPEQVAVSGDTNESLTVDQQPASGSPFSTRLQLLSPAGVILPVPPPPSPNVPSRLRIGDVPDDTAWEQGTNPLGVGTNNEVSQSVLGGKWEYYGRKKGILWEGRRILWEEKGNMGINFWEITKD